MILLLADDDADDVELFHWALAKINEPVECYVAENGLKVFDVLTNLGVTKPDFIFLDINMPKMDGWDCLAKLKGNDLFVEIPVVMYSTSSAKRDIEKAYNLGAALFISKPTELSTLSKILKIICGNPPASLTARLRDFTNVQVQVP